MTQRGKADDAGIESGSRGGEEKRLELLEEEEMGEMIGAELCFKVIRGCLASREGHDASIVDKEVECLALRFEFFGSISDLSSSQ